MVGIRTAAVLAIVFAMVLPGYAQGVQNPLVSHFRKGQVAAAEKHYEQAIAEFREVLKIDPNSIEARANLGLMYYLLGQYETAILELSKVTQRSGGILPAQLFLGISYLRIGRADRALEPLRLAVEIDSRNPEAMRALFSCELALRNYRAAGRRLEAIVRIGDPLDGHYQAARGYVEMATDLTGALAQNGRTSKWAHRLAGDLAADRKAWTEAVEEYRKAILADPTMPGVRTSLALALRNAGQSGGGETADDRPGRARLEHVPAGDLATGLSQLARYRLADAADAFAAAMERADTAIEAQYYLIRTYTLLAGENFTVLISAAPDSGRTHELEAELAALRRDFSKAAAEYEIAADRLPEDAEIREKLGEADLELGRMDEARSALEKAVRLDAGNGRAHYVLGQVLLNRNEAQTAIAELKIAVRYSPKLLEAHALLGRAYLHANQPALAIPELEKALALDYYGDLHFQLYKACLATGDTAAAQRALAISKEMRKKTVNAEAAKLGSGAGEPSPKRDPDQ
jgi:tetratricopeptide (TPR) repeat protein